MSESTEPTERVVTFGDEQEVRTDGHGALLVGRAFQPGTKWVADTIYAPGTWDRAEREATR